MITMRMRGDKEVMRRLQTMDERVRMALRRAIEKEAIFETGYVKSRKLSGQVLNVRTGTLRRSIAYRIESGDTFVTAKIGTNVIYAAIHEYGGVIHHYARSSTKTHKTSNGWDVKMPMRSFMRTTLADNRQRIFDNQRKGALDAVQK